MIRRPFLAGLLSAVLSAGCAQDEAFSGSFDTPGPIGVLEGGRGPFRRPVGYVADRQGGRIRILDLTRGVYLADDPFAPFFRGSSLATGEERLIGSVAPVAPSDDQVFVWATDRRFRHLLKVPHVIGVADGFPVEAEPRVVDVQVPEGVTLEGLALDGDHATSETWTFVGDGTGWEVSGTRSGRQPHAFPDVPWFPRNGALTVILRGPAPVGATVTITIDRGIEEIELPGEPLEVDVSPGQDTLALIHVDGDGATVLRLGDPITGELEDPLFLDAGAKPGQLAWNESGDVLLVTDDALPVLWEIEVATRTVRRHDLPWTAAHVAVLESDRRRAFLAPSTRPELWVLDLDASAFLDVNAATPEVDGMRFLSPVQGLAALPRVYEFPDEEDFDDRPGEEGPDGPMGRSVAVSLLGGSMVFAEETTGCLVPDALGPRTQILSTASTVADYDPDFPLRVPSTAYLQAIPDSVRHVTVNPCAGIAPTETWELVYDAVVQAWRVRGSVSDEQQGFAREDERYLSDRGEISFLVRSGATPSIDGWSLAFNVLDGVLRANGDEDGDGIRDFDLDRPGRPRVYLFDDHGVIVPRVVVAASAADFVAGIDPRNGRIVALWD